MAVNADIKTYAVIFCIISSGLLGCQTTSIEPQFFPIAVYDNIDEQKFDLMMRNTSAKAVCIDVQSWPNNIGELHYAAHEVSVEIESELYPIRDDNLGYCPTGCEDHVIEAGSTLKGSIPYGLFGISKQETAHAKQLNFSPATFECRK